MKSQQVSATLMAAILVIGVMSAIGVYSNPIQQAAAQDVTITTSADGHNDTFFNGWLQVIIDDDSTDDDADDTIDVTVRIESPEGSDSTEVTIDNTNTGSQRFELFVCHIQFPDCEAGPADPDSDISVQIVSFGDGVADIPITDLDNFDDATVVIEYGNEPDVRVDYDETEGDINTDQDVYGGLSTVRLHIVDQDGNLDPTTRDVRTYSSAELDLLFDIDGGAFEGDVEFEETADNSGDFEAALALDTVDDDEADTLFYDEDTLRVTYLDASDLLDADVDGDFNPTGSTSTSDLTIEISNEDGNISDFGDVTFATELKLTVSDDDANLDSEQEDTIPDALIVTTEGGDSETFDLEETDDNSGIFTPDQSNDEIRISFCTDVDVDALSCPDEDNGIVELIGGEDVTGDITITYIDPIDGDDLLGTEFTESFEVNLSTPALDMPETSGINDDFTVTVTNGNLNDNPRTRDTYTLTLDGEGPYPLERGGESIESLVTFEVEIESSPADFDTCDITETLSETGVNTGVFTVSFDMEEVLDCANVDVDDGDSVEFTINDLFDDQSHEASDELSIGKASTGIDFSRTALPIPPDPDSAVAAELGEDVFVTMTVNDPEENTDSGSEEEIDFLFTLDCADGGDIETCADDQTPSFIVEIDAEGSNNDETIECLDVDTSDSDDCDDDNDFAGSLFEEILSGGLPELAETGKTTGIFDDEVVFNIGSLEIDEWQDLEISITYIDADGDEEESGITFRGNDGVLDVDQDSVTSGTLIGITVQDEDLNLDDDTAEEFEAVIEATGDYILAVETDDDEVPGTTTETFRETGKDTGIFVASYRVGEDIPVTELEEDEDTVTQATIIRVTYNDEIDSGGGSGDEIELELPVVTATGSIIVEPDLVGPGTEVTVIIADSDLNKDASGTDDYDPRDSDIDPNSDDFFVNFRSDRNEVGEASPEIEETGANTGVFTFTIELITDENACEDDDLSEDKFDAEGGSEPSVGACPGDLIAVRYEDEQAADGRSTVVSRVIEVKAYDPEFVADKDSYGVGDKMTISISDPDANRDPDIADSLRDIRVTSDTDLVGQELSALETGRNTGVFKLSFATSATSTGGAVVVRTGDDVTIEYTDDFPADFEEEEDDKDFTFTVPIGAVDSGTGTTTPTAPVLTTPTGQPVDQVQAGQQVVLTTTINNNLDEAVPFVAIVEVRDDNGVTVFLAWQTGTLGADGRATVGLSWTPDFAGDYDIRTFVISSLDNPRILSEVKQSSVSVS